MGLIKGLWNQEHSKKENAFRFARNISRDNYMVLKSNLEKAPRFIYPVGPQGNQNLMMTGYHYDNLLIFSTLRDFEKKGFKAETKFTLVFFEELLKTKEICLVKGEATDFCSPEDAAQIFQ